MSDDEPPAVLGSWAAFSGGAREALADAATATPRGATTLIVTSAGPIVSVLAGLLGLQDEGFLKLHRLVLNGSLTKLIAGTRGVHALSVNEHAHLDNEGADLATYR
jgi:broad specificity phosphatase PhoE